jgi:hypothetical protein
MLVTTSRLALAACALAATVATAGCGAGDSDLTGRWVGNVPEDSLTFYSDGKVAGGSTWPCRGTSTEADGRYRLELDCGGWGQIMMTAKLKDATTMELTDHDGQPHVLRKQAGS